MSDKAGSARQEQTFYHTFSGYERQKVCQVFHLVGVEVHGVNELVGVAEAVTATNGIQVSYRLL